jgi:hypothetical protein
MSDTKDNGGTAFPGPSFTRAGHPNGHSMGMSLRDWFAGQALAVALDRWLEVRGSDKEISGWAYEIADAMLEARK